MPAIAVADALRERGAHVTFIGSAGKVEAELVPEAGYGIELIDVMGLNRRNPAKAAVAIFKAARAVARARRKLKGLAADVVIGGGGYVSLPVGLAAVALRRPLVLTEADSVLGLSNRLLAPFARHVFLSFPVEGRQRTKYTATGRPLPEGTKDIDRAKARASYGVEEGELALVVFGGSLGSRTINEAAVGAFAGPRGATAGGRPVHVIHICGRRDYSDLKERLQKDAPVRYRLIDYVSPGFAEILAAADLVIARSGGSIFEIAAAGRPAVLVPYPHATAGHQRRNAAWMVDAGAAIMIEDAGLNAGLLKEMALELLSDPASLKKMSQRSSSLARLDAAQRIAAATLNYVGSDE